MIRHVKTYAMSATTRRVNTDFLGCISNQWNFLKPISFVLFLESSTWFRVKKFRTWCTFLTRKHKFLFIELRFVKGKPRKKNVRRWVAFVQFNNNNYYAYGRYLYGSYIVRAMFITTFSCIHDDYLLSALFRIEVACDGKRSKPDRAQYHRNNSFDRSSCYYLETNLKCLDRSSGNCIHESRKHRLRGGQSLLT